MTHRNQKKEAALQALKEQLRQEVLQEVEADLKKKESEQKANAFREDIKNENRGHLFSIVLLMSFMAFGSGIVYFFPGLDLHTAGMIGLAFGAVLLLGFIIIRGSGIDVKRIARFIKCHPFATALVTFALAVILIPMWKWVVSGRAVRQIQQSRKEYVDSENRVLNKVGENFNVEPDGSLGIHCLGFIACAPFSRLRGTNADPDLVKEIRESGFNKVILYIDNSYGIDGHSRTNERLEFSLK